MRRIKLYNMVEKEKKYRVYTHSIVNGVYQVGRTCYQKELNGNYNRWGVTMRGCTKENCEEVVASSPEEAIEKVIKMRIEKVIKMRI